MVHVALSSFSYKTRPLRGVGEEPPPHGGGFVFDCRCLLNPGRQEAFREQTGKDEAVKQFLAELPEVTQFFAACTTLVYAAIENYVERGFDSLSVEFGCTGGQHRSVYLTECMRRAIQERWARESVRVTVKHVEMEAKGYFSPESGE